MTHDSESEWHIPQVLKDKFDAALASQWSGREQLSERKRIRLARSVVDVADRNGWWVASGRPDLQLPVSPEIAAWARQLLEHIKRRKEVNRPRQLARLRYLREQRLLWPKQEWHRRRR